jgi:hypothetical protein
MMTKPHVTAVAVCRYDDFEQVSVLRRVSVVRIVADAPTAEAEVDRLMALPDRHPKSTYFVTPARLTREVAQQLVDEFARGDEDRADS